MDVVSLSTLSEDLVLRRALVGKAPVGDALTFARRFARTLRLGLLARDRELTAVAQRLAAASRGSEFALRRDQLAASTDEILRRLADDLERDLLSGRLSIERRARASLTEPIAPIIDLPPLPPPPAEPGTHTFEVRFVDEVGRAVSGVEAEFKADGAEARSTNGAGIALLEGVKSGSATVALPDPAALAEVLDPRWEKFRPGAPPKESNTQTAVFHGAALGPFALKPELPNTVVIKPPLGKLAVELMDKRGRVRHANRTFTIAGPQSFEGTTDGEGQLLQEDVFPGNYTLSLALDFFEEDPDRTIEIVESPLVVFEPGAAAPQVRMIGAAPYSVLARLHLFFNTNKTFLLPTALPAIKQLRALYLENAPCKLLVVGHADTRGGTKFNDELSLERAQATVAYLRDDVEAWFKFYSHPDPKRCWGKVEDHLMIIAMPGFSSKPKGEDEVEFYQRTRGLEVDGKAGKNTRRALIAEYMSLDGVSLSEFVGEVDAVAHGCGENFPLDDTGTELDAEPRDEHRDPIDRRVELFFFDDEFGITPPPPSANSAPGSPEYPLWRDRVAKLVELRPGELGGPKVTFVEFADTQFRTDSATVMPEGEVPIDDGAEAEAPTAAGLIAAALRFNAEVADLTALVAGHTDTTAGDDHNQTLSELRAKAVLALLVGDRESFASICKQRHKVSDIKQILASFARMFRDLGFACAPKAIDETPEKPPVVAFQKAYNENRELIGAPAPQPEDGVVTQATFGAFFDCYEFALARELGEDAEGVAELRKQLVFADEERKALGFGEHFPIEELGVDEFRSQTNRRVEILFFQPGEAPDLELAQNDPETSELYLPGFFQRQSIAASSLLPPGRKLGSLFMELWDRTGAFRHAQRPYTIEGPQNFSGVTDESGRLKHLLVKPGDYVLRLSLASGEVTSPALVLDAADKIPQVRLLGEVKNVAVARLIGLFFDTNKCFLLPAAIPAIERVKGLYDRHPDSKLLIVGHTDTAGSPDVNDPLSLERAEAIRAYLTDRVEDWIVFYDTTTPEKKRWGDKEDRDMVSRLPDRDNRPASEAPMTFFRRTRGLEGAPLRDVRLKLIEEYMGLDGTSLPAGIEATAHGCGENFPIFGAKDGEDIQENRRVELFFFEDAIAPPPPGKNSGPGSKEYPEWTASAVETIDLRLGEAGSLPLVVSVYVGEAFPDLRGSLVLVGAGNKVLRSFPLAELPPGEPGHVFLELQTAGLPDPVAIRRVSEDGEIALIGPCSLKALSEALNAENFELAGTIGYPAGVPA